MAMAADGHGPWPRARTMPTVVRACGHRHVHIHSGHERGHITRLRCQYDYARSSNGYDRGLPRGERGRKTGVRGRRKEAEGNKETYHLREAVAFGGPGDA